MLPWELMETGSFLFRHENGHDVDIRGQDGTTLLQGIPSCR